MILGVLLGALLVSKVATLANGYATAVRIKREGHEAFEQCIRGGTALNWKIARDNDWYYGGSSIIGPDSYWYGDGSLRKDALAGKTYPKGMYFYNSMGYKCKSSFCPPKETKAPN